MRVPFDKRVSETIDFKLDFSSALGTDAISSVDSVTVSPSGLTIKLYSSDSTSVTVWVSDGTPKTLYEIVVVVETEDGRRLVGDLFIYVIED